MKHPYRAGRSIYLRPFDAEADAGPIVEWMNDPEVSRFTRRYRPLTLEQQREFFRTLEGDEKSLAVAVVRRTDDRLIGVVGLHEIDARHRNCWLGIVLGEKSVWGQGHGTEAMGLILSVAFDTLNLERVYLYVYEFNARAIHVYEKLGFRVEGRLRRDYFCEGRYWDTLVLGVLREEWQAVARQ